MKVKQLAELWRPVALAAAVSSLLVAAHLFGLTGKLYHSGEWLESFGAWESVIYTLIFAGVTIAAVPHWIPTVLAGTFFDGFAAIAVASIGSIIGASVAFLIARYAARKPIVQWLGRYGRFRKIERLTRSHGAIIVLLTRMLPLVPYNVLNYGFGLTALRFRTYVFWSWLGMLPCTVMYASGAAAGSRILNGEFHWPLVVFAAASMITAIGLAFVARRRLAKHQEKMDDDSDDNR